MKMRDRDLCKAKRLNDEEWVIGYLYRLSENYHPFIMLENRYGESYEVDEYTICHCTGRKDKNKKLIWENDIVRDEYGNFYKVIWQNNHYQFSWSCVKSDVFFIGVKWNLWSFDISGIEVVGNIFDNPELLD